MYNPILILIVQSILYIDLLYYLMKSQMGIVQIRVNGNNNGRNKIFFHSEGLRLFCIRTNQKVSFIIFLAKKR